MTISNSTDSEEVPNTYIITCALNFNEWDEKERRINCSFLVTADDFAMAYEIAGFQLKKLPCSDYEITEISRYRDNG